MQISKHQDIKNKIKTLNHQLLEVVNTIGHEDYQKVLEDQQSRIDDPFLFVIVGEVKAGKSSFINALLETKEDICRVAPSPMTDTIQQIVYGDHIHEESINPFLKKIYYPAEILKQISIVDTPGTNTIVNHHQEITERFVPQSDLIVFVFDSKNPYRESAWQFFDFISDEWRKKVIFVLQQKDLMEPDDLIVNIDGVRDHAIKKNIPNPNVFALSAKMDQKGDKEQSGFGPLRSYIESNITSGQAPMLKLQSFNNIINNINQKIAQSLVQRQEQYLADVDFRNMIKTSLDNQESKTHKQIEFLVENLLATYDKITQAKEEELSDGLSFMSLIKKSFSSMIGGDRSPKDWLSSVMKDFEQTLNIAMKDKLQNGVVDIADNIQHMAILVDSQIKTSKTILKDSDEIFHDIADRRANVLKDLQQTFQDFMTNPESFYDKELMDSSKQMAPNLAAGSGMAVIGVILATLTNGAVFDITGGILTTVGVIFAGASIGYQRRKILKSFKEEIKKGRARIELEVTEKLTDYTQRIKFKIDKNFFNFDQHLKQEQIEITRLEHEQRAIETQYESIVTELHAALS